MSKIKNLFISDLDGTLLNSDGVLTEDTKNIIKHITKNGEKFTFATARPFPVAKKIATDLEIEYPVIVYNGAFAVDFINNKILISNYFEEETNQYLKKIFKQYNFLPNVFSFVEDVERVFIVPNVYNKYYRESRKDDKRIKLVNSWNELYCGNIFSYLCMGSKEELQPIYEKLKKDDRVYCVFQEELYNKDEYWLNIHPKEATKAKSALKLKELLGCDRIVSFGDGINDIELFKISDACYAVENAETELKKIATGIIESNDNDGVAKWLYKQIG